ncbi:MAG: hypothetical protein AB8B56_01230 [Crocinitomicaceae bacterium]
MTAGFNSVKLPSAVWNFLLESMSLRLAKKLKTDSIVDNNQIWTMIPNEERQWIEIERLEDSIFSKKQNFLGLDFNSDNPLLASGKFWMDMLLDAEGNDLTLKTRNIYIVDLKMDFFLFYIEGNGLLVYGKDQSVLLRK